MGFEIKKTNDQLSDLIFVLVFFSFFESSGPHLKKMTLYIGCFAPKAEVASGLVSEITYMTHGVIDVRSNIPIYGRERRTASEYSSMVAFSFPAVKTYKLPEKTIYIYDEYTTLRFSDTFVIFEKDLTINPWNMISTLFPLPDDVINGSTTKSSPRGGLLFVNTALKHAVFDHADVEADKY